MSKEFIKSSSAHGLMFHHFYNEKHARGQGAISSNDFEIIIGHYHDRLISAEEFLYKAIENKLSDNDVCITFDDALLCQYDVALPVLEKYGLTAFWFVYSSVLQGGIENLEIFRKFRTIFFPNIDEFYDAFFLKLEKTSYAYDLENKLKGYSHDNWKDFSFYSRNDTKFRYIRDVVLGEENYNNIMYMMIDDYGLDIEKFSSDLWLSDNEVIELDKRGHVIGLHSHTHPTHLSKLPLSEQQSEYYKNYHYLLNLLGKKPNTVSHPCNSYNKDTLSIMSSLGVEIGFRSNMAPHFFSSFEFPREDHANIIRKMEI